MHASTAPLRVSARPATYAPPRHRGGRFGRLLIAVLLVAVVVVPLVANETLVPPPAQLREQAEALAPASARRVRAWADLLESNPGGTHERLRAVNDFFNTLEFVSDALHWGETDYWATPVEFLATGAGDCEDFALAKYFTLAAMGVPESQLKLTYVKALNLNQAHMVLTYYPTPSAVPLVLDNLDGRVQPATRRPDLLPVYSFNGTGLWLASQRGAGERVGSAMRLSRWRDFLDRLAGAAPVLPPALAPAAAEENQ